MASVGDWFEAEASFSEAVGVGTGIVQYGFMKECRVLGQSRELQSASVQKHMNREEFRVGVTADQDLLLTQEAVGLAGGYLQRTENSTLLNSDPIYKA